MWILLQLALAFTADIDQLLYEVKVHSVKIRSEMDRFEQKHTKSCNKIVNRLRYMADAESLGNRMDEQEKRFRRLDKILRKMRSVNADNKVGMVKDTHINIRERYSNIATNYHQCLTTWPDHFDQGKLAGR